MARLNKTQIYAIRWLNYQELTNDKIANELDINIEQVEKTLEKYTKTSTKKTVSTKTTPVNIINTTAGKGINGVSIMTKEGSETGDKAKKSASIQSSIHKSIFRPKNG
jgi:hypothetical protein